VTDTSHRLVLPGGGVPLCVDGTVTNGLLDLTNHHPAPAPVIEQRPERYVAYFENTFGEQLVFVHDDGEADATLYLGDIDWEPRLISDANDLPDVGDLILNREERTFLCACWIATARRREPRRESHRSPRTCDRSLPRCLRFLESL
jgi:hypothetical protein